MISLSFGALFKLLLSIVTSAVVIWAAQVLVLPKEKEKPFSSVLGLAIVWAIIDFLFNRVLGPLIRIPYFHLVLGVIVLVVWLLLLKYWFDVGWGHAILISVVAWILNILVMIAVAFIERIF